MAALRDGGRHRPPGPLPLSALVALSRRADPDGVLDPGLLEAIAAEMAARGRGEARLAGDVYERRLAGDRAGRRAGGAFYTPAWLVDFVVEETVGRALAGRSVDEALRLRVLDPACGGGAFLVAVVERLQAHCEALAGAGTDFRPRIVERCIRGVDLDPAAAAICRLALLLACDGAAAPSGIRVGDSLEGEEREVADVVVGNPPWGQKGFRFERARAAALRRRYRTATGVLDPFKLFVERTHELLAPGGLWGLVLPDIVLLKDQAPVRRLILEGSTLLCIADAGRAFAGVNLDAAVLIGRRADLPPGDHPVRLVRGLDADWRRRTEAPPSLPQRVFWDQPGHKLNIHLTEAALRLLDRLRPLPRLGQLFEMHEGVHTGNARALLFHPARGQGDYVPVVVGRGEIVRYRLTWAGTWLHRGAALDRAAGVYANLGRPEWHERPKLVVRRTGDRLIAAFDRQGLYCSNNLFVVLPRAPMDDDELAAYVALLNSRFATWYFRTIQPRTGRLFAELKLHHLADVPRPAEAAWRRAVPELAALARRAEREGEAAPGLAEGVDAIVDAAFDLPLPTDTDAHTPSR